MVEETKRVTTAEKGEGQNTRRLWLVRHGITRWNMQQRFCGHTDIPLSAQGRVQARWLAQRLKGKAISTIYTSDLTRARETAEIIASQSIEAVQVKLSAAWREINFGAWEGLTYAEIAEQFKDQLGFFTDPEHYSPPNGESLVHLLQRVQDELTTIARNGDLPMEGDLVIVSHGGPLRVLLCSLLGIPLERQWQLRLDPGSLSAIDLLPIHELPAPRAILALLNGQPAIRASHSTRGSISTQGEQEAKAASDGLQAEGTM